MTVLETSQLLDEPVPARVATRFGSVDGAVAERPALRLLPALPAPAPQVPDVPDVPAPPCETVELLGMRIDAMGFEQAVDRCVGLVAARRFAQVATPNVDFLALAGRDPSLLEIIERADAVVPDGVPLLWMARWQGTPLEERVNGTDLVVRLLEEGGRRGWRVFMLGGDPGVAEAAAASAGERYGVEIVGTAAPSRQEMDGEQSGADIARAVARTRPDLLLVALGGGRQEHWINRHRDLLGPCVAIGCGSALDFVAGTRPRAPKWMQRGGLEWAFRLSVEPGRLWRRYLVDDASVLLRFTRRRFAGAFARA